MPRFAHAFLLLTVLALPLAGCESMGNFDPSDWVPDDIFGSKKKLTGERKPVFPEGVPGYERGVPPELMRDPNAPAANLQDRPPVQRAAAEPEPKPKPKARPKAPPREAAAPEPSRPTQITVRPGSQPPPPPPPQQQPTTQWPDAPPTQPQRPPGGFGGGVQWPDPPPPPR